MAVDDIRIEACPGETRAAFLDAGALVRIVIERDEPGPRVGDIHAGRVTALAGALDAAFVDIGADRPGFLGLSDARRRAEDGGRIDDHVCEGQAIVVQVVRPPEPGKGAKLSRRPALAGRFLVFLPTETGIGVSRRLADRAAAERIKALLPSGAGGWLVRRAAADAPPAMLATEIGRLTDAWARIDRTTAPPAMLARGPDAIVTALREEATPALRGLLVDDLGVARMVRTALPDLADRVEVVAAGGAFADDDVAGQVAALASPAIPLPSGGVVTITPTPALIAVDVDTGTARAGSADATALAVNREAAAAIARRLRVADLGGYVVIDVVPLARPGHREAVLADLRRAVADDPRPVRIGGWTALGRLELTRRREGASLVDRLTSVCPVCDGAGRIASPATTALAGLRAALAEDRARPGRALVLRAAPAVIDCLAGAQAAALARTEERLGRPLALHADPRALPDAVRITAAAAGESGTGSRDREDVR